MSTERQSARAPVPGLDVRTEDGRTFRFSRPFLIGRDPACDVCIDNGRVSRRHVIVAFENGQWQLHDQQSGNGVLVDGRRVQTHAIVQALSIRLGPDGPVVSMEVAAQSRETAPRAEPSGRDLAQPAGAPGSRTIFFQRTIKRQRRTYRTIVAVLALIALGAAGYAYLAHRQVVELRSQAQDLFYSMKLLDVEIAGLEQQLAASGTQARGRIEEYQKRRREQERLYDQYLSRLNVYGRTLSDREQLILKVTRRLGECEIAAPPDYLNEVNVYIRKWQSTSRFAAAVKRARDMGYTKRIVEEFGQFDLPAQFFYLAMQESDFIEDRVGPWTRFGFAKGMWMFIPDTAKKYDLAVGPLERYPKPDPADERQHWDKATRAAARYIKDLYATDAQASGLLVMASYNWGENRVLKRIQRMPENPQERNFWKLLAKYPNDVPKETYDYVLMIVSAAVIGENPRMFGFPFDNPLDFGEPRQVSAQ